MSWLLRKEDVERNGFKMSAIKNSKSELRHWQYDHLLLEILYSFDVGNSLTMECSKARVIYSHVDAIRDIGGKYTFPIITSNLRFSTKLNHFSLSESTDKEIRKMMQKKTH